MLFKPNYDRVISFKDREPYESVRKRMSLCLCGKVKLEVISKGKSRIEKLPKDCMVFLEDFDIEQNQIKSLWVYTGDPFDSSEISHIEAESFATTLEELFSQSSYGSFTTEVHYEHYHICGEPGSGLDYRYEPSRRVEFRKDMGTTDIKAIYEQNYNRWMKVSENVLTFCKRIYKCEEQLSEPVVDHLVETNLF